MKLIIDRKKWLRGKGSDESFLLAPSGKMCCLGFLGLACGLKKKDIKCWKEPRDINSPSWPKWLTGAMGCDMKLMLINDDPQRSGVEREAQIAKILKRHKINVEFKG